MSYLVFFSLTLRPIGDKSGKAIQNIKFDANDVNEFEYKLNL
jgi:hypothetical protein